MGKIKIGEVYPKNEGGEVEVIEYNNANSIKVRHLDHNDYISIVNSGNLRKGAMRNPYKPSIFGRGYLGEGKYQTAINGKSTRTYTDWRSMFVRSYCPKYNKAHPSYKECEVDPRWFNFQIFAEWREHQPNSDKKGFDLDKDLRKLNKKVYSPETCSYLPQEINKILCSRSLHRGEYQQGVCKHGNRFKASLNIKSKKTHIGVFSTVDEAYSAYTDARQEYVRKTANEYKQYLHPEVYNNLIKWTLETIDKKED